MSDLRDLTNLSKLNVPVTQDVCRLMCENDETGTCAYYALDNNQCHFWSAENALNSESKPLDVTNSVNNQLDADANVDANANVDAELEANANVDAELDAHLDADDDDVDDAELDAHLEAELDAELEAELAELDADLDAHLDAHADQVAKITINEESAVLPPHGVVSKSGAPVALVGKEMPLDQHRLIFPNVRLSYLDAVVNRKCL